MEKNPTALVVKPHHSISSDFWFQFAADYPRCSNEYKLPTDPRQKYKYISAIMIANIFDTLISWQQMKKLYDVYESLGKIANDRTYPQQMQKHVLNLLKLFNTLLSHVMPFDQRKLEATTTQQQKINLVQEYLDSSRKYIYSLLQTSEGIENLWRLSRGIALSLYLKADYDKYTTVTKFLNQQLSREDIIKQLTSDDFTVNVQNHFILEDYEIVAISHLLSLPIHFFINYFEPKSQYLIRRRIHQQQSEEKTVSFLFDFQQNTQSIRILSQTSNIIYIQNLIHSKQNQIIQNFPQAITQQLQGILECLLNQITHDFSSLNQFWITKIIQILQSGEAQTLIANKQQIQLSDIFKKESQSLFQMMNLDQKTYQEFLLSSHLNLKQTEELLENIIISQVTMIRDQISDMIINQKRSSSLPPQAVQSEIISMPQKPKILQNNALFAHQTPNQFSLQKQLNEKSRLIPKILDQDLPNYSDSSEDQRRKQKQMYQTPQQSVVTCKEYNTDSDEEVIQPNYDQLIKQSPPQQQPQEEMPIQRPPKYGIDKNKYKSDVCSQKVVPNTQRIDRGSQLGTDKKRQRSEERMNLEMSYRMQNDYLAASQNRNSIIRAQSDINVLKLSDNKDNLEFQPKKSITTQNKIQRMTNSQVMASSVRSEIGVRGGQQQMLQSHITEVNETQSQISVFPKFDCPICYVEIFEQSDIRNLHDDHKVCKACLEDWVKVKFNAGQWNFKFFKCPIQVFENGQNKPCDHIIDQNEIKSALTPEEFRTLTDRAMKHGIIDIICPNTNCQASIKGMPPQNQLGFHCPKCNQKICWVCKNFDHGGSKCPQRLEEIRIALQDERVSCCPNCLEIYMKNEGCLHVSCTNCLIEFCFACSAHRPPILIHGAHYHRVGCESRVPWLDPKTKKEILDEEYDLECECCSQTKKPCPRPISLDEFKNLAHLNF